MRKPGQITRASLFLLVNLAFSCNPNPAEKLAKKWKPVDVEGEEISPDMKVAILQEGNMMEFTPDGLFISYAPGEKNDTGMYSLSANGKILKVNAGGSHETEMTVKELKTNRAIIENHGLVLVLEPVK